MQIVSANCVTADERSAEERSLEVNRILEPWGSRRLEPIYGDLIERFY